MDRFMFIYLKNFVDETRLCSIMSDKVISFEDLIITIFIANSDHPRL